MDQFLELLTAALRNRAVTVPDAATARALIRQQRDLYRRFASSVANVIFHTGAQSGTAAATPYVVDRLMRTVKIIADDEPKMAGLGDNSISVSSPLPVLEDQEIEALVQFLTHPDPATRPSDVAAAFPYIALAGLMSESPDFARTVVQGGDTSSLDTMLLNAEKARYDAFREVKRAVPYLVKNLEQQIEAAQATVASFVEATGKDIEMQRATIKQLKDESDSLTAHTATLSKDIAKSGEELRNSANTVREEMKLKEARESWKARYHEAKQSFETSIKLLAAYVVLAVVVAVVAGVFVLPHLMEAPKTDNPAIAVSQLLGRFIVISLPVFVFLWTMRAVMRYFMRSMLLMDDARQRETMLDTYFLLVENGRADERDRPMILWALFKQTPGHGTDGIEPPNFTEVINAGLERAKP